MSFIGTSAETRNQSTRRNKLYPGVVVFMIPSSINEEFRLDINRDLGVRNCMLFLFKTFGLYLGIIYHRRRNLCMQKRAVVYSCQA